MLAFISWYLLILLTGWAAFPIAFRFFKLLPDRGYAFSKVLGLLVWGYGFWMLASLQLLQNTISAMLVVFLLMLLVGVLVNRKEGLADLLEWVKSNKRILMAAELVFLAAFGLWAFIRALNPEIIGTEKPMELAFINAILRSPTFPPADPWLSGYSISYYYFGYVMVAMLIKISGVVSGVGFNLAVALWFGLTATAAYGLIFNLVTLWGRNRPAAENEPVNKLPFFSSLLGPFFILLVSNLQGFLEMLHSRGVFWKQAADGTWQSKFWTWLNILEVNEPPQLPFTWVPERVNGTWWWRASRVVQDYDLLNNRQEVIDEFPFFSYLLADLHPHVLAMPFAILAIGIALVVWMQIQDGWEGSERRPFFSWIKKWISGEQVRLDDLRLVARFKGGRLVLPILVLGGLAFLNTWDLPIYIALLCAVWALADYRHNGWHFGIIWNFIGLAVVYVILAVLFYLPFYIGFSSQAGGIIPSLVFHTRGIHFWVMFGPLLLPVLLLVLWLFTRNQGKLNLAGGLKFGAISVFGLWGISFLMGWLALQFPTIGSKLLSSGGAASTIGLKLLDAGSHFANLQGSPDSATVLVAAFLRRLTGPGTWLTLFMLVLFTWAGLGMARKAAGQEETATNRTAGTDAFILLLILVGIGLTLVPEFIYLRDQFGTRMNTIFKFYFQTWILWGLAAAYGVAVMSRSLKRIAHSLFVVVISAVCLMAVAYTIWGVWLKTDKFNFKAMTLDGNANIQLYTPEDWDAMEWLQNAPRGTIVEAVGGSYSGYARFSTQTGMPAVLGWPGHESQWRGGWYEILGSREADIETLYKTSSWNEAEAILERYGIRYVVVSSYEFGKYRAKTEKFDNFLSVVFQNGSVTIYEVPQAPQIGLP